jgi:hypothetical protein
MSLDFDRLQNENTSLKEELKSLRQMHEYTVLELADARDNE